jgi:hypothetical protein
MTALCPRCKEGEGEIVDQDLEDPDGVAVTFDCPECTPRWQVTF